MPECNESSYTKHRFSLYKFVMLYLAKSEFHNPVSTTTSKILKKRREIESSLITGQLFLSKSHFVFIYNLQNIFLNSEEFDKYILLSQNQYGIPLFQCSLKAYVKYSKLFEFQT